MDEVWKRIDAWLIVHAPEVAATLQAGATEAQLQEAEATLGVTLPEDVRASFRVHDGQRSGEDGLIGSSEFLSLAGVVEHWADWKKLLDSGELARAESQPVGPIRPGYWNARWIPLTYDFSGNHLCLDLDPPPGGQAGQVITMWHDSPEREVVAASFRAWLTQFADDLDAGAYILSQEYGFLVRQDEALGEAPSD